MNDFDIEVDKCCELLSQGKVIIYPTDTIWGTAESSPEVRVEIIIGISGINVAVVKLRIDRINDGMADTRLATNEGAAASSSAAN